VIGGSELPNLAPGEVQKICAKKQDFKAPRSTEKGTKSSKQYKIFTDSNVEGLPKILDPINGSHDHPIFPTVSLGHRE
jgi:hypothetical protein